MAGGREGRSVGLPVSLLSGQRGSVGRKNTSRLYRKTRSAHELTCQLKKEKRVLYSSDTRSNGRRDITRGHPKQKQLNTAHGSVRPTTVARLSRSTSLLSDDDPTPTGAAAGRRLEVGRSVGRPESGRTAAPSAGRVGRSGVPTQNLLRRAARGGSVDRGHRVGNALYGFRESVARHAKRNFNFASPEFGG